MSLAEGAAKPLDTMRASDWIAEEQEAHLLPHLEAASAALPLAIAATRTLEDGTASKST